MKEPSEKFVIQLRVGNQMHSVTVPRDQEKLFRDAAELINEKFNQYNTTFPHQTQEKYSAIVLIDIAVQLQKILKNNDTKPFIESMDALTQEILEALEETTTS